MKVIAFDLDETLLDRTASLKEFCHWQATEVLKDELDEPELFVSRFLELDAFGSVWKDVVYSKLTSEFSIKSKTPRELLEIYFDEFRRFCRPKEYALECVRELSDSGFRVALVTNGPSPFQEESFKALGMAQYFETVVVSGAIGFSKPDKRIFSVMCSQMDVLPQVCVFVGDNPKSDIEAASAIGMYTIFVPGPISASCTTADAVCEDFRGLLRLVQNAR